MHQPKAVFETFNQNNVWDFEVRTDSIIPVRMQDTAFVNKTNNAMLIGETSR